MKILYVATKYEYGDPSLGFSFEHYNFYDTLAKMNCQGNKIIYFPIDEMLKKYGLEEMNKKLLKSALEEKPDFCFFCLLSDEIKMKTIEEITKKSGAITFNWFCDDHWRFDNFSKHWAHCFNWIGTTDSKAVKKYHRAGYKNVILTSWACNHFICKPLDLPKIYDVTFLGQPHGDRRKIIKKIEKSGINIKCWGRGWPAGRVNSDEMIKIFSQTKIDLGLTNSSVTNFLKPLIKIFFQRNYNGKIQIQNPKNWPDNFKSFFSRKRKQLKGRNFEVPGCRSFLITDSTDELKDYYEDGKEIIIFKGAKDLIKKIKYYLRHEEEREKIAAAGYYRTIKEHTYEKRFEEIFKIIGLI